MISVIIPNYNSENTINRCINSVLEIKNINYEIIVIDDGSIDNSINILKTYEHKFDNIHVYYQKSMGVSFARNLGIKRANGEFICFLDSDDYINSLTFTKIVQNYINVENDYKLLISNVNKNNKIIGLYNHSKIYYNSKKFLQKYYPLYKKDIVHLLHGKIYNMDIIKQNNIEFPTDLTIGEDLVFNLNYISKINKIIQVNISYYNYFVNKNSVTKNYEPNILNNKLLIIKNLIKIYINYHLSLNGIDIVKIQSIYAALLNNFRGNAPKDKLNLIKETRYLAIKYQIMPNNYKNKNIIYLILMFLLRNSSDLIMYVFLIFIDKLRKL